MIDDEYVYEFYEDDPWEELGCVLGDKCLHHDPEHTSDECFDIEYIQEYYREGMRETEEYKLGSDERDARWVSTIKEIHNEFGVYNEHIRFALSELRRRMDAL